MISIGVLRRIRSLRIVFLSILSISKIDVERFERNAFFRCALSKLNKCTNFRYNAAVKKGDDKVETQSLKELLLGNATQGGIPIVMLIIGVLIGVYWFALNRTVYGRNVYAVGGNRKAAILSGIDTKATDFKIFLNMGFLTSIAAVITLSRLASATAQTGMEFEMDAIAACFIGGTAVTGGIGTIPGAMVGALIMGVLNQGLSIMGVDAAWVKTIKGLVVIAAVAYDLVSKRKKA